MREGEDFSDFEIFAVTINENYNVYLIYDGMKVANVCECRFEKRGGKYYLRNTVGLTKYPMIGWDSTPT